MVKVKRTIIVSSRKNRGGEGSGGSGCGGGSGESDTMESADTASNSNSDPFCINCQSQNKNKWSGKKKSANSIKRFPSGSETYTDNFLEEEESGSGNGSWSGVGRFLPSSSSYPSLPLVFFVVIIYSVIMVSSAIDMHPHGGFYQRGGGGVGNDFYSSAQSSAQQQSDFGGSDDMIGDMIMTCSRPTKSSRAAKYLAIKNLDIPCEMGDKKSAWCNLPGDKYPWHAVRRFVFENQGLMRRMYGEVRQLSLLRMEFEDDTDDEAEEERHGPPRGPPIPEDHRRNSILTEVLDESLPRVLSDSPPEDQILLRDHIRGASTPRSLSSITTTASYFPPSVDTATTTTKTTTSGSYTSSSATATTPPVMMTSEEQVNATEVMMGVTVDGGGGIVGVNTAAPTMTTNTVLIGGGDMTETASTSSTGGMTASTIMARNALGEEVVTEDEATQSTSSSDGITETEKDDGEVTITTTEEMLLNYNDQQEGESGVVQNGGNGIVESQPQTQIQNQNLNDGGSLLDNFSSVGGTGSMGSDESHDFLHLDKNHIVYFEDVGKNRRPVPNGGGGGSGEPPPQQQLPMQTGKLKAVNACPVKEEVVAPYWANNTRGEILALLNLYPFEQYIHWERCNHENKQMFCRQGCRCEQQYRLHRLLAFDPTNECRGIFSDWFRFPSCCVCRCYLNEYELMMLNAAGQEPSSTASSSTKSAQSRTSDRIRSPRKMLLEQLVDGPDVQGVDDMHFFYKQGFYHEHNHGAQPRRKRSLFPAPN